MFELVQQKKKKEFSMNMECHKMLCVIVTWVPALNRQRQNMLKVIGTMNPKAWANIT